LVAEQIGGSKESFEFIAAVVKAFRPMLVTPTADTDEAARRWRLALTDHRFKA